MRSAAGWSSPRPGPPGPGLRCSSLNPRVTIALVLATVLALGAAVVAAKRSDDPAPQQAPLRFEGATLPRGLRAPDFSLRNQDGERVGMGDSRGKPTIVTFLYTSCEESCPVQAQQIKGALNELGEDVPALAISVDPARDDAAGARSFLAKQRMTGRMDFLLGARSELAPVWKAFAAQPQRARLEHNARVVLVDPRGLQRVSFPVNQLTPERLAHDVRLLAAGH